MPSAIRRAMMRNPVWAIIRWSGRTASPSTCQPRTIASMDSGSANLPEARRASTKRESCGTVATYAMTIPPGVSASLTASSVFQGASMSRTTRSTLPGPKVCGRVSARSPTVTDQFSGSPSKKSAMFPAAIVANSSRSSNECTDPVAPTARSSAIDRAPDPTPASTTVAPGKISPRVTMSPESFG